MEERATAVGMRRHGPRLFLCAIFVVGTAALFGLVISLPGTVGFVFAGIGDPRLPPASLGYVNLAGFALIAPATVLAAPLGARIAHAFSAKKLSVFFGLFLVLASAKLFYGALAGA